MTSQPLSIRFDPSVLERLRSWSVDAGSTPSGLAKRLVDEGLRMHEVPGIVFRDGPAGRRAGLPSGPDVWEVIAALKATDLPPAEKVASVGQELGLQPVQVETAADYYARFPAEIDAAIKANELAATRAFERWQARQAVLA